MTHAGSKRNLLGANPSADARRRASRTRPRSRRNTPPTFLAQTDDDTVVPAENSLLFTLALRQAKVPVELHLFEQGPHGLGLGRHGLAVRRVAAAVRPVARRAGVSPRPRP